MWRTPTSPVIALTARQEVVFSVCGISTCWRSQALPGEGLPLLPLVQLPHGVVPHRPPLVRCGDGGGGAEGPVIHRARRAADAVGPHHAVAGQRAIALRVTRHDLSTVAGHVPGQGLVGRYTGRENRPTDEL